MHANVVRQALRPVAPERPPRAVRVRAAPLRIALLRREGPGLLLLVAAALVNVAILLLGHRTYFALHDNSGQFWPWYQKAAAAWHSGVVPLWDANTEAGHSFVGEVQTGVFYPLNIVWLLVLGSAHGISARRLDLLVVAHLWLASVGFYALGRSFRAGRMAAALAAVVFAYTGVVFARTMAQTAIFFGLTLVPWAMFMAHRHLETGFLRWAAGSGAMVGLAVLAGHFEPPFHAALLVLVLLVFTARRRGAALREEARARLIGGVVAGAAALVVALPQLVYTLPYLSRAYRFVGPGPPIAPGHSISFKLFSEAYSGEPASLLSLLDPQRYTVPDSNELYIGLAALAVLVFGLAAHWAVVREHMGRYRRPLGVALAIGLLAMLGPWTLFPRVLYALPLVAQVRELGRYSIMVHVVLCLTLAIALQALLERRPSLASTRSWRRTSALALGALIGANGIYLMIESAPGSDSWFGLQVLLGGLAVAALAARAYARRAATIAVAVLIVAASLDNGARVLGHTSSPLYPPHYFAREPVITFAEKACAGHRTLLLDESLPRNVSDVFRAIRTQNGYGATLQAPFLDFISHGSWTEPAQTRLLDIRCIIATTPLGVPGYAARFAEPATGRMVYVNDSTSALNTPQLQPIATTVLAQQDRRVRYAVDLARPTTVIVSAIVYPGWKLSVDGAPVHVASYRLDREAIFPEVSLSPGRHVVEYSWSGWPA